MSNFFDTVVEILKADDRFFTAEGEILRNAVYEAAMKMDANLQLRLEKHWQIPILTSPFQAH